jgi:2,3-bisphosphoglycerate-dependent phosphoglycerate mutase
VLTIYFEPHAASVDNLAGLASGHHDSELSETGRRRARDDKRPRILPLGVDVVFTSDLRRAYETAAIVFEGTGTLIVWDPRLRECDYGDMTREPRELVFRARERAVDRPFPNGESYAQVVERVRGFLEEAAEKYGGSRFFIIGHFATLVGLEQCIKGTLIEESFKLDYGEIEFPLRYEWSG